MADRQAQSGPGTASFPLYVGGLAVTLCGVQAVCASMNETSLTAVATLLTVMGFAFSLACRYLRVAPRVIEIACGAVIAYIFYVLINHSQYTALIGWFVQGAEKTEERLAAGLMWSAVLWSWTLVSSENVMFSCVLTAAMIGLTGSVDVNNSTLIWFCLFVLAMTFLLIHQNYLQNRALASRSHPVPAGNPLRGQLALSGVCALLVLGIGVVVVIPMRNMLSSLSLGQALRHLVGSSHLAGGSSVLVSERFSDDTGLEIGRGPVWPTSSTVVMHVSTSDNQPHYWRGRTYDLYTGAGWLSTRQSPLPLEWQEANDDGRVYHIPTSWIAGEGHRRPDPAVRRSRMTALIDVRGETQQFYYADEPRLLQFAPEGENKPALSADGYLDLSGHAVHTMYSMSSSPPPDVMEDAVQQRLRHAGEQYPPSLRRLYLDTVQSPQNVLTTNIDLVYYRNAVRQALRFLPPNRQAPVDKALAIRDWISSQCTYSLSVEPLPAHADHVHEFLAHSRRGYCDLFASAMVMLCRTAGIPARLATGFAPGQIDDTGMAYDIRALDKHAWAEVYFPGNGWLIFDPTVGSRTDGSVPTDGLQRETLWQRALRTFTEYGPLPGLLFSAIALCLAYVVKRELYDRWRARKRPASRRNSVPALRARTDLGRQYALMVRSLAHLGLPRRASETPAEYEARALPWLAQQERELGITLPAATVSALTARFTAARYGGSADSDPSQSRRLVSHLANTVRHARRVRWWRRIVPKR